MAQCIKSHGAKDKRAYSPVTLIAEGKWEDVQPVAELCLSVLLTICTGCAILGLVQSLPCVNLKLLADALTSLHYCIRQLVVQ